MSHRNWSNEEYYQKAKESGYRARSAFKLIQIDRKYDIFKLKNRYATKILDLGCHPGSFLQVIHGKFSSLLEYDKIDDYYVLGVDLTSIKPINSENIEFVRCDIFEDNCAQIIEEKGKYDVILSDLAPKTSGDYRDVAIQESMVSRVFELLRNLNMGGNVMIKIFESPKTQEFVKKFKRKFRFVKITKPDASREKSKEKYMIGKDFL